LQLIEKRKQLLNLPFNKDQIEYWGPISNEFSDAFLGMGRLFLQQFLGDAHVRLVKGVFSSFVEMVQNIAEYNQKEFEENIPQSFVHLMLDDNAIIITTINKIKEKDVPHLSQLLTKLFAMSKDELKKAHREALLDGKSLGLIMIKKIMDSELDWEINKDETGNNWFSLELKINYGSTKN